MHRPIALPNSNYEWSVDDESIGLIEENGLFKSRVSKGTSDITVVDQRMINNSAEGQINVVYPYRLVVRLRDVTDNLRVTEWTASDAIQANSQTETFAAQTYEPASQEELDSAYADKYILIEEHEYLLEKILYDADGNVITLTDNLQFETLNLDDEFIEIVRENKIKSEIVFRTKKILDLDIDQKRLHTLSKLKQIRLGDEESRFDETRVSLEKEIIITRPVKIMHIMDYILLPFLPTIQKNGNSGEIWNTYATGGSGIY